MGATTIVTRAGKGSALTHSEMDTNLTNLNNVGVMVGSSIMWNGPTVPDGTWLEEDGSSHPTASYPDLFGVIGYRYGGSGANFNLPDKRGYFIRGYDHGAGNDPDAASRTDRGDGTTGDAVGTKQVDGFKAHTHSVQTAPSSNNSSPVVAVTPANVTGSTVITGSTGGTETRPKNVTVMFIIKARLT